MAPGWGKHLMAPGEGGRSQALAGVYELVLYPESYTHIASYTPNPNRTTWQALLPPRLGHHHAVGVMVMHAPPGKHFCHLAWDIVPSCLQQICDTRACHTRLRVTCLHFYATHASE